MSNGNSSRLTVKILVLSISLPLAGLWAAPGVTERWSTGAASAASRFESTRVANQPESQHGGDAMLLQLNSETAAFGCLPVTPTQRSQLSDGTTRLAVSVSRFTPTQAGSASFELSSFDRVANGFLSLHQFAIHPVQAFDVRSGVEPHRFLFSLSPHAMHTSESQYCFKVAFSGKHGSGGFAVMEATWTDLL